jgi:hypothetical protein
MRTLVVGRMLAEGDGKVERMEKLRAVLESHLTNVEAARLRQLVEDYE